MVKKKITQASWYRVAVKHRDGTDDDVFVWDVLASDIDLAKQVAVAELGDEYQVVTARYMGGKAQYRKIYDPAYGFEANNWRLPSS